VQAFISPALEAWPPVCITTGAPFRRTPLGGARVRGRATAPGTPRGIRRGGAVASRGAGAVGRGAPRRMAAPAGTIVGLGTLRRATLPAASPETPSRATVTVRRAIAVVAASPETPPRATVTVRRAI